mmetsp:Transcript_13047/g.36601  ORF Transcript_13047/g.36601 Transcript_13047/m.36601 type:complete len:228 (+) Transcript_13047:1176-1859(+)
MLDSVDLSFESLERRAQRPHLGRHWTHHGPALPLLARHKFRELLLVRLLLLLDAEYGRLHILGLLHEDLLQLSLELLPPRVAVEPHRCVHFHVLVVELHLLGQLPLAPRVWTEDLAAAEERPLGLVVAQADARVLRGTTRWVLTHGEHERFVRRPPARGLLPVLQVPPFHECEPHGAPTPGVPSAEEPSLPLPLPLPSMVVRGTAAGITRTPKVRSMETKGPHCKGS